MRRFSLKKDLKVTDCVIKFLKELGGLIIRHPHAKASGTFYLGGATAVRRVFPNWVVSVLGKNCV